MLTIKKWRFLISALVLLGLAFGLATPVNAQTAGPQAAGDPRIVSGVVRDGTPDGHTWPLYARIDITGYSGGPVFTDPRTGAYSVELEEGDSYTFAISTLQGGYQLLEQSLVIPANDVTLDFNLQVDEVSCKAQGYALVDHWTENFDSVTAPALPANWASQNVIGFPDPWVTRTDVNVPPYTYFAYSSPNLVYFHTTGGYARLTSTAPVDMTGLENQNLTFWMFQNGDFPNSPATVQVKVSTDNGLTWQAVGPAFDYYGSSTGWVKRTVDLGTYADQTGLLLGFESGTSSPNMGYIYIDSVSLGATCESVTGALVTGRVLDENTGLAVNGVLVQSSVDETRSLATPLDTALGDGYYSIFAPAGDAVPITAAKIPYAPHTETCVLDAGMLVAYDLLLAAGQLVVAPNPINMFLAVNSSGTLPLHLNNNGGVAAEYILTELNLPSTNAAAPLPPSYAGEILDSFSTGINFMGGLAYNPFSDELWIQDRVDVSPPAGDDRLVRFLTDSTATGDMIALTPTTNSQVTDFVFNPRTATLWVPGSDSCIHEFDPVSRQASGQSICPAAGLLSMLAYDPVSDTYFGGRIDTNTYQATFLYHFTPQGDVLESATINKPAYSMTFNPATDHLFTLGDGTFYVWDVENNYQQDGVIPTGLLSGQFGLEFDCSGSLWAVIASISTVYKIASGESGTCEWMDIPWLSSVAPIDGSIDAGGMQSVTLTFNSTGLMPGIYIAQLDVSHNTPYEMPRLPVTLFVGEQVFLPLIKR